jgi:hypothetical protein
VNTTESSSVLAGEHTMGERLPDYVLPKIPLDLLTAARGRAWVYPNRSLSFLLGGDKRVGKRFNWRRPYFTLADGILHGVVPPGQDYTHHYAELLRAACAMTDLPAEITVEQPIPGQGLAYVDHWLPRNLPAHDLAILGYVEPLLTRPPASSGDWNHRPGFGWRTTRVGRSTALLLGCEFSFWGDLAGDLVTALISRGHTSGVLYVGKLGGLRPDMEPNTVIVTGTTTQVKGHPVSWKSALDLDPTLPGLRSRVRHITVASVLDETRTWLDQHRAHFDVVDPEIGHMALAATTANVPFDYLHIVTDNLNGTHDHGLYAERSTPVATRRRRCLHNIETILHRSLA